MNEEKRAGWTFWSVVAVFLFVSYCVMIGPACWLSSRVGGMDIVSQVYRPVTWVSEVSGSDTLMAMLQLYSALGSTEDSAWEFSPEDPGKAEWISGWFPISTGGTVVLPLPGVAPSPVGDADAEEQ